MSSIKPTENAVVDSLVRQLREKNYEVEEFRKGTRQGHDIKGKTPDGRDLYIECKGSWSPRIGGREFSKDYKWKCASGAVFNQLRLKVKEPHAEVGIAFPDDPYYKENLMGSLIGSEEWKTLGITVYWVSEPWTVEFRKI